MTFHQIEDKVIQFPFVKSEDQLADILTKAVSNKIFHNSFDKLGIEDGSMRSNILVTKLVDHIL